MTKVHAQHYPVIASCTSGCLLASASFSASLVCNGYSQLLGFITTDASLVAGSGLMVLQSIDFGQHWDLVSACDTFGSSTSAACSIEVIGNAVRVFVKNGTTEASAFRTLWHLRPV